MRAPIFTGSGVAIVTPFTDTGIDFPKLAELIEFHVSNKTDAIVVAGTTGEASTMPDEEHKSVIKFVVEKTAGRIPVIAGTGSNDTRHAVNLSRYADEAGVDGLLIVTPYYNKTSTRGLIEHYRILNDSVKKPIILYNIHGRTGMNIAPETMRELAKFDNIVAVKEASGSISQVAEIAALCPPDFTIYSGDDNQVVPMMSLGAKGVISVIANIAPTDVHNMVDLFLKGNIEESRKLQLGMLDLIKALFIEVNPIPIKAAMNMMGFNVGDVRLPLYEISDGAREKLKTAMLQYGLTLK